MVFLEESGGKLQVCRAIPCLKQWRGCIVISLPLKSCRSAPIVPTCGKHIYKLGNIPSLDYNFLIGALVKHTVRSSLWRPRRSSCSVSLCLQSLQISRPSLLLLSSTAVRQTQHLSGLWVTNVRIELTGEPPCPRVLPARPRLIFRQSLIPEVAIVSSRGQ